MLGDDAAGVAHDRAGWICEGSPMIRPVERPVPLRQSVYEALVELVIAGRLS